MLAIMKSSAAYRHSPVPIVPISIVAVTPMPTNTASIFFLIAR